MSWFSDATGINVDASGGGDVGKTIDDFIKNPTGSKFNPIDLIFPYRPILRGIDEAFGEITGRNLMREQMFLAEKRLQEEAAMRQRLLEQDRFMQEQSDIAASSAAAGARRSFGRGRGSLAYEDTSLNKDFLGL